MKSLIFQVPRRQIFTLTSGRSPFQHTFGGPPQHLGSKPRGKQPLHLLHTFDLADPALGMRIRGIQRLPLYYCFVYDGCSLAYQMISDDEIRILGLQSKGTLKDFPFEDYPAEFPRSNIRLKPYPFNPRNFDELRDFHGVFGSSRMPREERARYYRFLASEYRQYHEGPPPRSLLALDNFFYGPFLQAGYPLDCPNEDCVNHQRMGKMHVLAIVQNEPVRGVYLWGQGHDFVSVIFLICPRCHSLWVGNECT